MQRRRLKRQAAFGNTEAGTTAPAICVKRTEILRQTDKF